LWVEGRAPGGKVDDARGGRDRLPDIEGHGVPGIEVKVPRTSTRDKDKDNVQESR
jgi:hypothetical protein